MDKFFSFFDAEALILRKKMSYSWPDTMVGVSVYPDEMVVRIKNAEDQEKVSEKLEEWFGSRYDRDESRIIMESPFKGEKRFLPVVFEEEPEEECFIPETLKPSFASFSLYPDAPGFRGPDSDIKVPPVYAFYSFKGGVSRTIHLISMIKALSEQTPPKKVLIIDADLEAPGLTWWAREQLGMYEISFLDFLALAHYDNSDNYISSMSVAEERLRQQMLVFKTDHADTEHFFLPAFRDTDQLLSMPLRPEHLAYEMGKEWIIGELLWRLGKKLNADAVFVDLRAGLSELSSPLLFDPRINRIIVTTPSGQSLAGTRLVLEQTGKVVRALKRQEWEDESQFPAVILSMVKEDLQNTPDIEEVKEQLMSLLIRDDNDVDGLLGKEILLTSLFDENLLYLKNLDTTLDKLNTTDMHQLMTKIADEKFFESEQEHIQNESETRRIKDIERLKNIAEEYEFAESGRGTDFLKIQPLRSFAQKFQSIMPVAVVMGAKGSGKTFIYLQLARIKVWNEFLKTFDIEDNNDGFIYPLIFSKNLQHKAKETIGNCCENIPIPFNQVTKGEIRARTDEKKVSGKTNETIWKDFWLKLMADSLFCGEKNNPLKAIQKLMTERDEKIIFQIDGLEDHFQNVRNDPAEQTAIRALCQSVTETLQELPDNRIGLIIFIRKDIVRSAIKQNFGQFEARYKAFELKWDWEAAIRLVLWLLNDAELKNYVDIELPPERRLEKLWGLKLGKPGSREAYTLNWIIAALSDFNGQIQARDIVRLIRFASGNALELKKYPDRLLPPAAVRNALDPCSEKKIEEIKQEITILEDIFRKLENAPEQDRQVPFDKDILKITQDEIEILKNMGIVTLHNGKYYMPEIIRRGLKFGLAVAARPRVLALLRRAGR
ncbi:MAG: hypothetical protein DRI57_20145 [Deltaproteobacteria bacterium]|nr:MAG: hypothetical protein DRI57_20145 [Deltaproteobacteria bacterium]